MTRIIINGVNSDLPARYPHTGANALPEPGKLGNGWRNGKEVSGKATRNIPTKLVQWEAAHQWAKVNGLLIPNYQSLWQTDAAVGPIGNAAYVLEEGYKSTLTAPNDYADNFLVSSPELWGILDVVGRGGVVAVVHYNLTASPLCLSDMYFRLHNSVSGLNKRYVAILDGSSPTVGSHRYLRGSPSAVQKLGPPPSGEHKAAIRITDFDLEYSVDGGPVFKYSLPQQTLAVMAPTHVSLEIETATGASGSASSTIHHVNFYDPADVVDDAALSLISA